MHLKHGKSFFWLTLISNAKFVNTLVIRTLKISYPVYNERCLHASKLKRQKIALTIKRYYFIYYQKDEKIPQHN